MFKQQSSLETFDLNSPESFMERLRFDVEQVLNALYVDVPLADQMDYLYLPFCRWLSDKTKTGHGPLMVGIGGAQGCGKTTFCAVVSKLLNKGFDINCIVLSLDDLYLTRKDRLQFSNQTTSMFSVRGVPGTHDVTLASTLFNRLKDLKKNEVMKLPCFDKSIDDRKPVHLWKEVQGPVDIVLFEGWCVGATPITENFSLPINDLEREKDPNGLWRETINRLLENEYKQLFSNIDLMVWMQAPNYEVVYEWRNKQERLLEEHLHDVHGLLLDTLDLKVMSPKELQHFMQYYERLTKHMLTVMPEKADVLFKLNANQEVIEARFPTQH